MRYFLTHPLPILTEAFSNWKNDKSPMWGAALSYFTVFSLSPLLLIIISIAGLVFGREAVQGRLFTQLNDLIGGQGAVMIQEMVQNASKPSSGVIGTIIGFVTLLLGASGVFGQLKEALNAIWQVEKKPKAGFMSMVKDRFLSFSMVAVVGFLLLVSLVATSAVSILGGYFQHLLPFPDIFLEGLNFLFSFFAITVLFALIFKLLPDVRLPWKQIWVGAVVTSLLFTIGKTVIGYYLGRGAVSSTFGAAASLAIILVWTYYAAQILFFGAELIKALIVKQRIPVTPRNDAVFTKQLFTDKTKKTTKPLNKNEILGQAAAGVAVEIGERIIKSRKQKKK
jgi:membrane protein